jgi:predicted CXXCH cytochrome family protein
VTLFFLFLSIIIIAYAISKEQKGDYLCLTCHDRESLGLNKKFVHPLVRKIECSSCHREYNKDEHFETNKPVLDICVNCHTNEELGRSHPVGNGIIDPNTQDVMSCVSSCHLPHGSDYKYQLPFRNNMELCLSCHKDF